QVLPARDLALLELVADDLADVALLGDPDLERLPGVERAPLLADHVLRLDLLEERDRALLALLRARAVERTLLALLLVGAAQLRLRPLGRLQDLHPQQEDPLARDAPGHAHLRPDPLRRFGGDQDRMRLARRVARGVGRRGRHGVRAGGAVRVRDHTARRAPAVAEAPA